MNNSGNDAKTTLQATSLPRAESARWQPLRSGLLNLYRYDNQEFHFHRGRMLLRGNNGTGKSRVLALQLPFLLDGETAPHRVEPDADPAKRFEWNLLMGRYDDRLGYTWIEFGRREDDGREHFLTLGCGIRAVSGRGIVGKWFFVTPQRIGRDLMLCAAQGNPVPKDSLIEALAPEGRLFTTASDYRAEINRRLFELRPDRYEALVDLLIELRQPQLARHLDESRLSTALSNALTPVSQKIIAQVADAMRGLEEDRLALANLVAAKQGADGFLKNYRQYAAIQACKRSQEVRTAHSTYENRQRKLRDAEIGQVQATGQRDSLLSRQASLAVELAAAQGDKQTLEGSPEMRSRRDLDVATTRASERKGDAQTANLEHIQAVTDRDAIVEAVNRCGDKSRIAGENLDKIAAQCGRAAALCTLGQRHDEVLQHGASLNTEDPAVREQAQGALAAAARDRRRAARTLATLNRDVVASVQVLRNESADRDKEAERVAEAAEATAAAERQISAAVDELSEAYRQWCASVALLKPMPAMEVVPEIRPWCEENRAASSPVRVALDRAWGEFNRELALQRSAKSQELKAAEESYRMLRAEHERLSNGEHQPPLPPYTRDSESRSVRDGAPFWALCEFRDHVSDEQRAGIEAALEASGLLDAWVNPDGTTQSDTSEMDTFLLKDPQFIDTTSSDPTLADLLRPSEDCAGRAAKVSVAVIERIIRRVGLGENRCAVWVDQTGRWQIGPKTGRWAKAAAQHLGHAAREAARLRRLRTLDNELTAMSQVLLEIRNALIMIDRNEATASAEAERAPDEGSVRTAIADRDAIEQQWAQNRVRLQSAETRVIAAAAIVDRKTSERDTAAADLNLKDWIDRLQELEDALGAYEVALATLWPAARERISVDQAFREEQLRLEQSRIRADRLHAIRNEAEQRAAAADAELRTLHQTIGAAVEVVQRRLREVEGHIKKCQAEEVQTAQSLGNVEGQLKALLESIADLRREVDTDIANRAKAIEHLVRFAATGLLALVVPGEQLTDLAAEELSVTAAVEVARRLDSTLSATDYSDEAWDKNQKLIHHLVQELTIALQSHDYRPESTTEHDVLVVTVPFQNERRGMDQFSGLLAEEIVNRGALLTAKERELLENYLIHDVAVELGSLIRRAAELVRDMSKQLQVRPTSTGMMLQFKWEPLTDGPPAFSEARKKLLGESSVWSPADRRLLGDFLQEQIRRVREAETTGTWQEQLTIALDYRRWHQFYVERKQDGDWQRLTKRTHGTGSGGEKALALTIPQFAAAAAYYGSAGKFAPRLILLDEAFVGIDSDMRAKCMGMLHEFDLDFVMTSEREWGCYTTMPGLAIYQLSARAGIDAVWASRWVWNGRERVQRDHDLVATPAPSITHVEGMSSQEIPTGLFHNDSGRAAS